MNILYRIISIFLVIICFGISSCAQGDKLSKSETRDVAISQSLAEKVIAFRLFYDKSQDKNIRTDIEDKNPFGFEVPFDQVDFDSGNCIHNFRFKVPEAGYYHIDLSFQVSYYVESVASIDEDCDNCISGFVDRDREILLYEQKGNRQILKIHSKLLLISQQVGSSYPFAYSTIIKLEKGAVLVPYFSDISMNYSLASFSGYKIY